MKESARMTGAKGIQSEGKARRDKSSQPRAEMRRLQEEDTAFEARALERWLDDGGAGASQPDVERLRRKRFASSSAQRKRMEG